MPLDSDLLLEAEDVAYLSSPLATLSKILPNARPRDHQKLISDAIVDAQQGRGPRFVAISIGQQLGKALALDTPIPTPSGWTTIGGLQVGDEVFAEDGTPTRVVALTEVQHDRPCYAMRFDDGEVIVADANHEWLVNLNRKKGWINRYFLRTTKYIAKGKHGTGRDREAKIRKAFPLQLPYSSLLIPPYTLGLWLGDGHTNQGTLTSSHADRTELRMYVHADGYPSVEGKGQNSLSWRAVGLFLHLKQEGLLGNKHIPMKYLRASESQRWELLQGLIDSDGHVTPQGMVEFCTTKEELAEGFRELCCSLGLKPMMLKSRAKLRGRDVGPRWRINFYHPNAARLYRKRIRCRYPTRRQERYADAVETTSVAVRCIQVEADSGMFLAGRSMIPTHNSSVSSVAAPLWWLELHSLGVVPGGLVGILSYEDSLAMGFSTKVRRTIDADPSAYFSQLRKDSRAASFWETEQGGGIYAVGMSGSVQGRPLSLLIIDDPIKSFEQAMSPAQQDRIWDNWTSVIYGRLQPWTVVLVTCVRWAPDDFIGRLASTEYEGDPTDWRFINIPLVCDSENDPLKRPIGEPLLRPQADFTLEDAYKEAANIKKSVSQYAWATLWQQNPVDAEGTILPEAKWRYWGGDLSKEFRVELPKEFDQMLFSWDLTFKDLKSSDWVVGGLWGRVGADYFLIELERGRWGFTETARRIKNFAQRWRFTYPKAITVVIEDKANGPGIIDSLRSTVGGLVEFDPSDYGSKLERAYLVQPYLVGGNMYCPAPSERSWVRAYTKELADFRGTGNERDDQVDMTSQAILHMGKYQYAPVEYVSGDDIDLSVIRP